MAGRAFRRRIRAIRDGEPVSAGVANRPDFDLQCNLNYLLDLFDDVVGGQGAIRHRATLDPDCLPGYAVYWDAAMQRFAPALAAVSDDPLTGDLILAPSTDAVGIVLFKENSTLGDVLLSGYGTVDLALALQDAGPVVPGRYYLSTRMPGTLTRQRPALSVSVLVADGAGGIYVQPTLRNFLEDHVHYEFRLHAVPAGSNGGTTVTDPDPTKVGWLPADHVSFAGNAPVGAAYGYNLKADTPLLRVWPPIPLSSANIFWDKGQGHVGATVIPRGPGGLVVIDGAGIWWMSNVAGDVPWPSAAPPEVFVPPNDPSGPENPRLEEMQIILTFTRMLFATSKSVVTSIRPAEDSPLFFLDCDGNPASTGDLQAGINLDFVDDPDLVDGGIAFKRLEGSTFRKGWMVEGLRAGLNCRLGSDHVQVRGTGSGAYDVYQGVVTVDALIGQAEQGVEPEIERLADAQQRYYQDIPYIGFGAGRRSGLRYVFDLPVVGLPSVPLFKMRLRLLGRAAGSLPALTMTYRRLPRPAGAAVPLPDDSAEQSLLFPSSGVTVGGNTYVEIESDTFAVVPGDVVVVLLLRSASDGYTAEIGVLRSDGVIVANPIP
jgi:hypothetical protein